MFGIVLACILPIGLAAYWRSLPLAWRDRRVLFVVLAGYATRLILSSLVREFPFFSYGSGGDSNGYELVGNMIWRMWSFSGIHYVTAGEFPDLGPATLPVNLFAAVSYLNDGPSHIGCVAVVAAIGCATTLNIYCIAHEIGCRDQVALWMLGIMTFLPTFVFYTSDTHKDGLVAFFVFGVFGSAIRLARRLSFSYVAVGLVSLAGLWVTRYYLVFIMWIPLVVGLLGARAKSLMRVIAIGSFIAIFAIAGVVYYSTSLSVASENAADAYAVGTSENSVDYNVQTAGSGTVITGSGPSAIAQKLAYSLFAPFPWQSGSVGLQLSKVEMLLWYYFAYRSVMAVRLMLARRRSDLLLFALFIVPTMAAYTLSFSNVGLALRERMNVVLGLMLLASFSWGLEDPSPQEAAPATAPDVPRGFRLPSRVA